VNSDPLFTNLGARDFHPQSGIPAIDVGINSGLTMDFEAIRVRSAPVSISEPMSLPADKRSNSRIHRRT
jgi:hypothetical protein